MSGKISTDMVRRIKETKNLVIVLLVPFSSIAGTSFERPLYIKKNADGDDRIEPHFLIDVTLRV